jgi:integrase
VHKTKLTDFSIRALAAPEKGHAVAWDDGIPGFGVRVSQGGTKSFFLLYGRERARHQIGRVGVISLAEARQEARRFLAQRTLGHRETPTLPFSDALTLFLSTQDHLRDGTKRDYERLLKTRFEKTLKHYHLAEIQSAQVSTILDDLADTPAERKYAHSVIRRFFKWAVGRRLIDRSPVEGMDVPKPVKSRDRVLTDTELEAIWDVTDRCGQFGMIVKLLILTGQRANEIARLQTSWIKEKEIVFPKEITKNGVEHLCPLGLFSSTLIPITFPSNGTGTYLFPARGSGAAAKPFNGFSKSKLALDKKLGDKFAPWTLHDLRRTFATNLAKLGTPIHVTERLLNHTSGTMSGIVAVYQRHDFHVEMRAAIEKWETRLLQIVGQ